jgi:WD40 repeat protein/tetratricopeptide (TPR) repeat protein
VPGYEVLGELGRGGMGVVYKALQKGPNRLVALKVILSGPHAGEAERVRFRTEGEAVGRLQHPNIVQVYEVGEHDGRPFLSLEYVDGGSLAQRLDGTPLPARPAAALVEVLARAIHYAHERGVVHRDLNPSNVLLPLGEGEAGLGKGEPDASAPSPQARFGAPKVSDFGLAKRLDGLPGQTASGAILGTPSYMAPEQAAGRAKEIGPAADVYALGAILYELLTGRPPFKAETALDTLLQVLEEEPVSPARLQPKCPRDLETITVKCLQKEPRKRYGSALELADDLARFLRDEPIRGRPVGPGERLWRWCRRNPWKAGPVAAVAFLLAAAAVGSLLVAVHVAGVNADLGRARDEATRNAEDRAAAQGREAEERRRAEDQLVQVFVQNGLRAAEDGDTLGALPWLAQALWRDGGEPGRARAHRMRLAAVLRECPRLLQVWHHGGPVEEGAFSPDGGRVALLVGKEVHVLDVVTGRPVGPPLRQAEAAQHLEFSPDGRRLLVECLGRAQLWDAETGRSVGEWLAAEKDDRLLGVAYTAAGPWAVTADGKEVRVRDLQARRPVGRPIEPKAAPQGAVLSPDGRRLVTMDAQAASLWDVSTRQPVAAPLPHPGLFVFRVAFSPDGRQLVTARDDGTVRLWDAATGRPLGPPLRHGSWALDAAFSPDGRLLLTGGTDDTARLWEVATGKPVGPPLTHRAAVVRVAFSPDGRRAVTCCGNRTRGHPHGASVHLVYKLARPSDARVWDVATGKLSAAPLTHEDSVLGVAFSPDGGRVLSVSADHTARLWDLAPTGLLSPALPQAHAVAHAAFSPDGRFVLTAGGHAIHTGDPRTWEVPCTGEGRVWGAENGRPRTPVLEQSLKLHAGSFSPDGGRVVTGGQDGTAQVWDARTGGPLGPPLKHGSPVGSVAFTTDGRHVVTVGWDEIARLWGAETGQEVKAALRWEGSGATPGKVCAYAPDGRRLLTISPEGVGVWDATTGQLVAPLLRGPEAARRAAFSADGRRVLTADAAAARVWEAATGGAAGPPLKGATADQRLALSPDGSRLLAWGADGTAHIWDVVRGERVARPLRLGSGIAHGSFSPDGRWVLTASLDGAARLWDARTGLPVGLPLRHADVVTQAVFAPDGRRVVTTSQDRTARVWDVAPDDRPAEDLVALARLLSGREVDASGALVPVAAAEVRDAWQSLRPRYPADFDAGARLAAAWLGREAQACEGSGNWPGAVLHLDRLLATAPGAALHARRGNAHAELGRWGPAAADYGEAARREPDRREWGQRQALLCLAAGDGQGYRKACALLLDRFGQTRDPAEANALARACAFAPAALPGPARPVPLAELAVRSQPHNHAFLNTLGAVLYRAGRFEEAVQKLKEGAAREGNGGTAWDFFVLAMACHRLNRAGEARDWLARAAAWMDRAGDTSRVMTWDQRLELQLLRREATELLGEKAEGAPGARPPGGP